MENKQYYVEIETESWTEVYECKNLNDSRECVKEVDRVTLIETDK